MKLTAILPILPIFALSSCAAPTAAQTVIPTPDPSEKPGQRPYEMVQANRQEPGLPTVTFDHLQGWTMQVSGGAEAVLQASRAQNIWDRPVAELRYHGDGKSESDPRIRITPPQPVPLPTGADSVDMWVWGNRWDWESPADTPPVVVMLHLSDAAGLDHTLAVDSIRWQEWWLMHLRLPAGLQGPLQFTGLEFSGGRQPDWRHIYLDSIRFYHESVLPLDYPPLPRRNLTLFDGQSPGANTGAGVLPFPTRETTILPEQIAGQFHNSVVRNGDGSFTLQYRGRDERLDYTFTPAQGLGSIRASVDGAPVGALMDGAGVKFAAAPPGGALQHAALQDDVITADYADGTTLRLRVWQKSLVVDVINRTGNATELNFGQQSHLNNPRLVSVPFYLPAPVLLSDVGQHSVFISLLLDPYRSNASEPYGAESAGADTARINGGVRYNPRTDGQRNPLFERLFLTVSPMLEETLPTIPNPVGIHAPQAVDRLWQESWGPANYANEMSRSEQVRAYGITQLIQCNHEITWRDNADSFTFRVHAAPGKGGDQALQQYVAHQEGLGWLSGLYTNYTDLAPVNSHWSPDAVQRTSDGSWRSAWARCYAAKPLWVVQQEADLAPQVHDRYHTDAAYTDVHTAVAPWTYCDYDARLPGAGTFAQTFYAYGQLLQNDSRVYGGPVFSEGTQQWLYAGLDDGNYGHAYNTRPLALQPLLPVFDLREIHPRECDIGVGWTGEFCAAIPNWNAPANLDHSIDRFLLNTLAYGHIGWLVEDNYGMDRVCRSYYMLQQVQSRYGLKRPEQVAYWDGARLHSVSEAVALGLPETRRQLYVRYPGGLELWLNDSPTEDWKVQAGGKALTLPPAGWAVQQQEGDNTAPTSLVSWSALQGGRKVDYLRSGAYIYLDGRGQYYNAPEAGSDGALAISPDGPNRLQIVHASGTGTFSVRRPYGVMGTLTACQAWDVDGKPVAAPVTHDSGEETWVEPAAGAIRYELQFSGQPDWSIHPSAARTPPGGRVTVAAAGAAPEWNSTAGEVRGGALVIPPGTAEGSWVAVRASSGGQTREMMVRVAPPVQWRWRIQRGGAGSTADRLVLEPTWNLAGLPAFAVVLQAPPGWTVNPSRFTVDPRHPPEQIETTLASNAPAGATGSLVISLEGLPQPFPTTIPLRRVEESSTVVDVVTVPLTWGIARRGAAETTDAAGSGAQVAPGSQLTVGGVTKLGIFMHPPYNGGVGYTWAETAPIQLPNQPCHFHSFIGLTDGGDPSDGVLFQVEVVDAAGVKHHLVEKLGLQHHWDEIDADLSPFAGQKIRLRLLADVGPNNNSTADWSAWGQPEILLTHPAVITEG